MLATSLQGSLPAPATLKTPAIRLAGDVLEGTDDVVLLDELDQRVEADDGRQDPLPQVVADGRDDVGAQNVGEPEQADRQVRVVVGEVPDDRLHLDEGPLETGADGPGALVLLAEPDGVPSRRPRRRGSRT